jgi:hypothetical protein
LDTRGTLLAAVTRAYHRRYSHASIATETRLFGACNAIEA